MKRNSAIYSNTYKTAVASANQNLALLLKIKDLTLIVK